MKTINTQLFLFLKWKNIALILIVSLYACESFVEPEPPKNELTRENIFVDKQTIEASLIGIYSQMTEGFGGFANYQTTLFGGLCSDELDNYSTSPSQLEFYENSLMPDNVDIIRLWSEPYEYIYQTNAIMEGLYKTENIAGIFKDEIRGEALFIRAFCHFYLANFFGNIPYITTTDYIENAVASRDPINEVYEHIINDLKEASSLLPESYVTDGRLRPNKHTVQALLARVYLYNEDWKNAEILAENVIKASQYYQLEQDLNSVFLVGSKEAIWQLYPVITGLNTIEGYAFILSRAPYNVALNKTVFDTFDSNDLRKDTWIGTLTSGTETYYYPYKYKVNFDATLSEYYMVFRLAEQYLIRAEARAQLNNLDWALADLNKIRNRAGLENFESTSKAMILEAIYTERQRELFAEWGHRWFDLKRTGRANEVLSAIKPGWETIDVLFPIPQSELQNNPNMPQNPGY
ncbi:RagB/SusD family nutrient uptake outer membrane protein [Zhouia spongiae]|uniref:RagB/SusD family nutrient uptake outer membrane protein n=1 Tax=Zhouia spongiae TaxID=2202721 RepID=A0ABY3YJC1_9FLAO|nr:RagB/SusD family nutrient uptake outer membrane protein [Zhouia spongiae]UNY97894.1 RagB/SusD family nutrient uptake outer membrane protein [Zhouia spongiae]